VQKCPVNTGDFATFPFLLSPPYFVRGRDISWLPTNARGEAKHPATARRVLAIWPNVFLDASSVRFGLTSRHKGMKSKTNQIKPVFAPETEFQVETLTLLHSDQETEDPGFTSKLDLSMESEFVSWPRHPFSALND
jgi:hypothetical protein